MPFNLFGEWVAGESNPKPSKNPVKVRLMKRGKNLVTVILNLDLPFNELTNFASTMKKKLGCGGSVKDGEIEIQGDKVSEIKKCLEEMGIKSS